MHSAQTSSVSQWSGSAAPALSPDGSVTQPGSGGGKRVMSVISSSTHGDDSLAEAEGTSAAVLGLVLGLVVAQGVVLQDDPAVLPAVDVVGPLEMSKEGQVNGVAVK